MTVTKPLPAAAGILPASTGRKLAAACCLTSLLLLSLALASWQLNTRATDWFLILIDAGSVHTSVYTYR